MNGTLLSRRECSSSCQRYFWSAQRELFSHTFCCWLLSSSHLTWSKSAAWSALSADTRSSIYRAGPLNLRWLIFPPSLSGWIWFSGPRAWLVPGSFGSEATRGRSYSPRFFVPSSSFPTWTTTGLWCISSPAPWWTWALPSWRPDPPLASWPAFPHLWK